MTARTAPTSTVSSSSTLISRRVPATGDGTSVSTLSVDTSSSGSSTATSSPTDFNHRVTVPSVTLSPRAGRVTSVESPPAEPSLDASASSVPARAAGSCSDGGSSRAPSSVCASSGVCDGSSDCDVCSSSSLVSSVSRFSLALASLEESPDDSPSPPMTASTVPTSTVSSCSTLISRRVPATGDGTSVSTLSVDTSSSGSSTATSSPTALSHWVTVPSVTDSPRAGSCTSVAIWSSSSLSSSSSA